MLSLPCSMAWVLQHPPALQDGHRLRGCGDMLCTLFADTPDSLAAVLAGSSLPRAALQLAARLGKANIRNAADTVGATGAGVEHACA